MASDGMASSALDPKQEGLMPNPFGCSVPSCRLLPMRDIPVVRQDESLDGGRSSRLLLPLATVLDRLQFLQTPASCLALFLHHVTWEATDETLTHLCHR